MNKLDGQFPIHVLAFSKKGEGDEIADFVDMGEITEVDGNQVEIAITVLRERIYLRMRRTDLLQAIKEMTP
ncbi:MAG TPA: hypothetical protein VIM62_05820 [Acidobacteriaceae bacterium]